MSDSNRGDNAAIGLIAAIIILLALAVGSSHERAQDSYRSHAASSNEKHGVDQFATPKAGVPAIAEAFVSNPEPDLSNQRERRDLAAQESMAAWAFWMAFFAGITTVITSAGTLLIWRQVKLTREAVEDTGKATKAMVRQNELTEEAQRPWLKASVCLEQETTLYNNKGQLQIPVKVRVENVGSSVALEIAVIGSLWVPKHRTGAREDEIPLGVHTRMRGAMGAPTMLFPNDEFVCLCSCIVDDIEEAMSRREWHTPPSNALYLFLGVTVSYRTRFDTGSTRRLTHLIFSVHPSKDHSYPLTCGIGNKVNVRLVRHEAKNEAT